MTRVSVDGVVFENDRQVGIRRIFWEVMSRTAAEVDYTLWLRRPPATLVPPGVTVCRDGGREFPRRRNLPRLAYSRWSRGRVPPAICRSDVVHATYFTRRPCNRPAFVVSVYDMVAELAFAYAGGDLWAEHMADKRAAILSATLCVAISEATATDLVRLYPEVAGRVRVVHCGADHLLIGHKGPETPLASTVKLGERPFVLFVGERNGYKNFYALLEAVATDGWPPTLDIYVVGRRLADYERRLVDFMDIGSRVRDLGQVSDDELRRLYSNACCLVYPSRLEGFGLPLLEAQASRCPVVCSDIPVMHEVAGSAALYFDPRCGARLAAAVTDVCEPEVRRRLVDAGIQNVKRFSWERAAGEYAAIYAEAAVLATHGH